MPNSEYWATVAQVLPVLALAVVVEARAISQRWTVETPKWLRFMQSLIWVVTLVVLALGESAALRALRGVQVSPWWTVLTENAISAAISLLIIGPALELLTTGYAEAFARMMTGGWLPRLRLALMERRELRQHRRLHRQDALMRLISDPAVRSTLWRIVRGYWTCQCLGDGGGGFQFLSASWRSRRLTGFQSGVGLAGGGRHLRSWWP